MNGTPWNRLASWHNQWLRADPATRDRLERDLRETDPDLLGAFTELKQTSDTLDGFLETPAFVAAARRMARELPQMATGATVGPYRVGELVARGGMGTVYRAHDTRLHRDVALKVLAPVEPTADGALDRFLREARLTASIDHPNVVRLYDVGVIDHQPYLVMEWLEGRTLRSRLTDNTLTTADTLGMARDVARGLGAAHAAGLVHRDLKPENIVITRAGDARILDFGIAKLMPGAGADHDASHTATSFLVGTAGYLAPEQIRGDPVDARADLFALGAIVFECLTGQRAFAGTNTVDTLHATLHAETPAVTMRDGGAAPALLAIAQRLIEKAPADRFQSAADLLWALEHIDEFNAPARRAVSTDGQRRIARVPVMWIAASVVGVLAIGAFWNASQSGTGGTPPLTRFTLTLPEDTFLRSAPVVSPDGRRVAWVANDATGVLRLYVRDLSANEAETIPGTEGARQPFWSPTSASLGFFANGKLKKVALGGGTPVELADAPDPRGGAWSTRGVIVFQPLFRDVPLMRVAEQGGPVVPVSALEDNEAAHRWPAFLPDGEHFLFEAVSPLPDRAGVYIGSIDGTSRTTRTPLIVSASNATYVPEAGAVGGFIVDVAHGQVELRRFDAERRQLDGEPTMIDVPAVETSPHHAALVAASRDVLVTSAAAIPWGFYLTRSEADGRNLSMEAERMLGGFPRLSPDGRHLAVSRVDTTRANPDIWVDDLTRGTRLRLTNGGQFDVVPAWSPDARYVAFRTGTIVRPAIGVAAADGSGTTQTVACPASPCEPSDWLPSGRALLVTVDARDIWLVPVDPSEPPTPLLSEAFVERDARVSPDGRWIAYVSDESGQPEVYVRALSAPTGRYVISAGGGDQPVWDPGGRGLYFVDAGGRLVRVTVNLSAAAAEIGPPVSLGLPQFGERHWGTTYDVGRDGVVYYPQATAEPAPRDLTVVLGWQRLLPRF